MDGRMEILCVLQDFVPFGSAALLLCVTFKNEKQGMVTADHMISLDYMLIYTTLIKACHLQSFLCQTFARKATPEPFNHIDYLRVGEQTREFSHVV